MVKNDPKSKFEQVNNSQCSKQSAYFSPIHSSKFIIMLSNLSGAGRFSWEIQA